MIASLNGLVARILAVAVLCTGVIAVNTTVAAAQSEDVPLEHVQLRDDLIAAQESLLNVYRCRFDIDTQQVPGGCRDGEPSQGSTDPGAFTGTPTTNDILVRDELITAQEALLNVYRCRFDIDTQLVPGNCSSKPDPVLLDVPETAFTAISASLSSTCGLRSDGRLHCWGSNATGLPHGSSARYETVAVGHVHICAIRLDGTLDCWGSNDEGVVSQAPEGQFVDVASGQWLSCGLRDDSTVQCWGFQGSGAMIAPDEEFKSVDVEIDYACGLLADNSVTCWGLRDYVWDNAPSGELMAIAVGPNHVCGLRKAGNVHCWGMDHLGDLYEVPKGSFTAISSGKDYSCALQEEGSIKCWGYNDDGILDNIPHGSFMAIAAGVSHACALREDGAVRCWGSQYAAA
ncbi:RCC1 domain-containing protein [Candidatus Poriferisocius sp.]|uniref:RCC1 domain-containing protein n=1 Tax=Candidatus Poriferisocius sp. TaxID=3101276 RepID=UPI003B5A741E